MLSISMSQAKDATSGAKSSVHESDLSEDVDLLRWHIADCRRYIGELEGRLGERRLEIEWVGGGQAPVRAHDDDAGFDLIVSEYVCIEPGQFVDVHHDVCVALPPGHWAQIVGRSSTLRTRGVLVASAVIDTGYRGPLFTGAWNLGEKSAQIEPGERISQLIVMPNASAQSTMKRVDRLSASERGDRGFGSSGL